MPCLVNFQKKPMDELRGLLAVAYKAQKQQLEEMLEGRQSVYDKEMAVKINQSLQSKIG